jgi:predicted nucleic acid-binding protein
MRPAPDAGVVAWLRRQASADLATTAVSIAELHFGVARLPTGRRATNLKRALAKVLGAFPDQVLPFDAEAAAAYGTIAAAREAAGRPIAALDAEIAAICNVRSATLATRNTKDFQDCGIATVDPWTTTPS